MDSIFEHLLIYLWVSSIGSEYWHILLGRALSGIGSSGKIALASIIVAGTNPLGSMSSLY